MEPELWNSGNEPKSHDVGLFSDLALFGETLRLASERGRVAETLLTRELDQRLRGLFLMKTPSLKVVTQLLRELRDFDWIKPEEPNRSHSALVSYSLTAQGDAALSTWKADRQEFRVKLAGQMHRVYVVPGWFVARLWQINRAGQGEIIIPAPLNDWRPDSRALDAAGWTDALSREARRAAHCARETSQGSFPIEDADWTDSVERAWRRLSKLQPKNPVAALYQPRERLHLAMRDAAIRLLFDRIPYRGAAPDFPGSKHPIPPRSFRAWCLRLAALEFISYTDTHPNVRGRLIFPAAVFRRQMSIASGRFKEVGGITTPNGASLWLHQPDWQQFRSDFWNAAIQVHREVSLRTMSLYVSLLDVRDEVCRQLRLSADSFDDFLSRGLREMPRDDFPYSVSVETDIREDQLGARGRLRRPVYVAGVPHSLIAIARLPKLAGSKAE